MPSGAAGAAHACVSAASPPRRRAPRLASCEAPRVAPGPGGGTWKSHLRDARAATRVARRAGGLPFGSSPRAPPACVAWKARALGARKSDWDLMDEELRGMRATGGGATALGVDYGLNRTGLAVSAGGIAPRPLDVVGSKPIDKLVEEVVRRAVKERADVIVVGLPVPPNMTAAQAAGLARAPRRKKSAKDSRSDSRQAEMHPNARLARVDVAVLAARPFRAVDDLEDWLGADGLKRELTKHKMKAGGTARERAERLWRLIDARGVLNDVPARFFPGNARGKDEAMRTALANDAETRRLSVARDDPRAVSVARETSRGAFKGPEKDAIEKKPLTKHRPPRETHVMCRRFAERVADAAAALDVPIPVELYDESRTSLQAGLAVEASRGARGAAASLGESRRDSAGGRQAARLDDVAAALLLERYFKKDHGPALPVKPKREFESS